MVYLQLEEAELVLVVDRRGQFIQVSPSSEAILGYRPEELTGRNAAEFLHTADLEQARAEMRQARRARLMRNFEASPWLEAPQLVEIKASKVGDQTLNEFNLFIAISRPKEEASPGQARPAPPAQTAVPQPKA